MGAYYSENDPALVEWLRKLIAAGEIAPGDVDDRSIEDVCPSDLIGYTQHHFFAGIGIWSYALRQSGWPDDLGVWTGSCPCQPFSQAGKGKGFADERHLWPAWLHLIRVCRPDRLFGEQVADQGGLAWVDLVRSDMESENFAFGPLDICAAGFGAPHIRQRTYFSADTYDAERRAAFTRRHFGDGTPARWEESDRHAKARRATNGFWRDSRWRNRGDGKFVGLGPGVAPLAHVDPATMVKLRAYGNAIVAEEAIEFVTAYTRFHISGSAATADDSY